MHNSHMTQMCVHVLKTTCALEESEGIWKQWQKHPNSAWHHYQLVLTHVLGVVQPYVVVAYRGTAAQCLVAGRIEYSEIPLKLGYYDCFRPRLRALVLMHEGLLGDANQEVADLLIQQIRIGLTEERADIAILNSYRMDSTLYQAAIKRGNPLFGVGVTASRVHRSMRLPGAVEDFWNKFSSKARKNLRRQCRQIEGAYQDRLLFRCYQDKSQVDTAIRDAESVAKNTYQRAMGVGFIDNEFTRQRFHLQAAHGELVAFVLYIDERPCAFWFGSVCHGIFHSSSMGYDNAYSNQSPGMYLIIKAIEYMTARKTRQIIDGIDFGLGDAQYKEVLGDAQWREATVYLFAPNVRGQMFRVGFGLLTAVNRIGRWILERSRRINQARQSWRRRLRQRGLTSNT